VSARLRLAAGDIKLAHSIFALPFALLAAFLARPVDAPWGRFIVQLALIVAAMVTARTWAMLVNRVADRRFDAANPRTQRRAVASGRLPVGAARGVMLAAAAVFIVVCAQFLIHFQNPWPLVLSVPVLGWIALYSYTKRFTALCHLFLGGALAASVPAAALAVNPAALAEFPGRGVVLALLAGMVMLWVAGFDVIYALQDVEFDRSTGLRSIPAKVGWRGGIWASRLLHTGAFLSLVLAAAGGHDPRLGWAFGAGVVLVGLLLVLEHTILARRGKAGLDMAFFTVNGVVSCVLGVAGILDLTVL
jgi:4-hydroxybenzoate polyprenyltransferase